MLTLNSKGTLHKAMYDLYTHAEITTDGRELLEVMGVQKWKLHTEVQLGMILSIQDNWKSHKDPRGGKFTPERFRKKFDRQSEENIIPGNTEYAISRLNSKLQSIQDDHVSDRLGQSLEVWLKDASTELLQALTDTNTRVNMLLFNEVPTTLQWYVVSKIEELLHTSFSEQ